MECEPWLEVILPNLTSVTPLFKGSDIGLLLARGSNFGRMPFLPPPVTHIAMTHISTAGEPRFTECKSVALSTDPWPHSWALGGVKNYSSKIRQDEVSCLSPSFLSFWPFMRNDRQCNILLMTVLWRSSRVVCRHYTSLTRMLSTGSAQNAYDEEVF